MSAYDDAVAYLDAEVHPRCNYEIYIGMRDIVDEMEDESAKLRELCGDMMAYLLPDLSRARHYTLKESMAIIDDFADRCHELGVEVP